MFSTPKNLLPIKQRTPSTMPAKLYSQNKTPWLPNDRVKKPMTPLNCDISKTPLNNKVKKPMTPINFGNSKTPNFKLNHLNTPSRASYLYHHGERLCHSSLKKLQNSTDNNDKRNLTVQFKTKSQITSKTKQHPVKRLINKHITTTKTKTYNKLAYSADTKDKKQISKIPRYVGSDKKKSILFNGNFANKNEAIKKLSELFDENKGEISNVALPFNLLKMITNKENSIVIDEPLIKDIDVVPTGIDTIATIVDLKYRRQTAVTPNSSRKRNIKLDLESIHNKYKSSDYKYKCNQCDYEINDALTAYFHLIKSNDEKHLKKCVCEKYSNTGLYSYKMHMLSKHRFYTTAEQLLNKYFTVFDGKTGVKIEQNADLDDLIPKIIDITSPVFEKATPVRESKIYEFRKRNTSILSAINSIDLNSFDSIKVNHPYNIEVLEDGSSVCICNKCKRVFLSTINLYGHECITSNSA